MELATMECYSYIFVWQSLAFLNVISGDDFIQIVTKVVFVALERVTARQYTYFRVTCLRSSVLRLTKSGVFETPYRIFKYPIK